MEHPEEATTSTWGRVCVCVCDCVCVFVCTHAIHECSKQTNIREHQGRQSRPASLECLQQGTEGGGGTQKRCLAGHSSMVGFLHVQFVYLNSFHFNYEGIPFNIWWLLLLMMVLLLLSHRVVSCPSPLLSCTVLLQLLNVARSLSCCR